MSCTTALVMDSYEEPIMGAMSCRRIPEMSLRRRRHSSYHPSQGVEADDIYLVVNRFVAELNRRLDFLESYGQLNLDAGIEFAWSTLQNVRDACYRAHNDGRRRANIIVSTMEGQYKEALARKETWEQKVFEGVRIMDALLADFEARAYAMKDISLGSAAYDFLEEKAHQMGEGVERVKEAVENTARQAAESIENAIESALAKARKQGLISIHEIPDPWRINQYILSGYRFHDTKTGCLRSVFGLSNEWFNIWSHIVGLGIVLSIAFYFYPTSIHFSLATKSDVFMAGVFFFAACKCLVCSTMWHTFNSIAEKDTMERFACVDYTGISLLVAASIMTTEYTAFYCEPISRWTYILTTAAFGIAGTILPWHPTFNRSDMHWLRVAFYCGLACTGALPVFQLAYTRGFAWLGYFYGPLTRSLAVYFSGAILYACKVPERWFPGMFDYVGGSHNIWHVAVLGGILFHYNAMQTFFEHAFTRSMAECSVY